MKSHDTLLLALVLSSLVFFAGCSGEDSDTKTSPSPGPGGVYEGKVDVSASVVPSNPEPKYNIKLKVTVTNGLLDAIKDVKAIILTDPVNMVIPDGDVWKNIASSMKNTDEDDVTWRITVKDKSEFVPSMNPETLKVRVKYKTSVKAANTFKVSDSADAKDTGKSTTTSDIVPISIEIDPKEVPLDKDAEVAIEILVKKTMEEDTGVLKDEISRLIIDVPRSDDFDLTKYTCEYEDAAATKQCRIVGDQVTLEGIAFHDNEILIRIILPLKESSLPNLRGTQKSVTVTLEDVWLYSDRNMEVSYTLGE